jgi:Cu-Zn family superoxide dismutase
MRQTAVVGAVLLTTLAAACSRPGEQRNTTAEMDTMRTELEPGPITPPPGDTALNVTPTIEAPIIDTKGAEVGMLTLTQDGDSVRLAVRVRGLSGGLHGIHFHENSRCDTPDFASAGGHFNPEGRHHGLENPQGPHAGDLPNLRVTGGMADTTLTTGLVTLAGGPNSLVEPDGRSLIIHADQDDQKTDPAGNSGARVACAVIPRGAM